MKIGSNPTSLQSELVAGSYVAYNVLLARTVENSYSGKYSMVIGAKKDMHMVCGSPTIDCRMVDRITAFSRMRHVRQRMRYLTWAV